MSVIEIKIGKPKVREIKKTEDVAIFITFMCCCTKFLTPKANVITSIL